jgi:nuclear mRNA export protein PCID2/THP1
MLPTVIGYSQVLARLAIGLNEQPHLIAHVFKKVSDEGERESLPERAASTIQKALTACLSDRSGFVRPNSLEGKRVGLYVLTNICLKILFKCNNTRNIENIFVGLGGTTAPPLRIFPWPERVTYLFYLGRYLFTTNHFYRASLVLEEAFNSCSPKRLRQRRLILIYLTTSNIICGRFPSQSLYNLPEANGFRERFAPICRAINHGDLQEFRRVTDYQNQYTSWFLQLGLLLPITNRCEVLVYRSLFRRTFMLVGYQPGPNSKGAPSLELKYVAHVAQWMEQRARLGASSQTSTNRTNWIFKEQRLRPLKQEAEYDDLNSDELEGLTNADSRKPAPSLLEIEFTAGSLVTQGLINGYISHKTKRVAILGAKKGDAVLIGFPSPWRVIRDRCEADGQGHVPGWKKDVGAPVGFMGRVVTLSGVKPIGQT